MIKSQKYVVFPLWEEPMEQMSRGLQRAGPGAGLLSALKRGEFGSGCERLLWGFVSWPELIPVLEQDQHSPAFPVHWSLVDAPRDVLVLQEPGAECQQHFWGCGCPWDHPPCASPSRAQPPSPGGL